MAFAWFKYELKYSGSTGSFDSNYVGTGTSAKGNSKHTDGQVWGSALWPRRVAFDVSIVNPTAVSPLSLAESAATPVPVHWHMPSLFSRFPNAGTRAAEKTKTDKYKLLCQQRASGMDLVYTDHPPDKWWDT